MMKINMIYKLASATSLKMNLSWTYNQILILINTLYMKTEKIFNSIYNV